MTPSQEFCTPRTHECLMCIKQEHSKILKSHVPIPHHSEGSRSLSDHASEVLKNRYSKILLCTNYGDFLANVTGTPAQCYRYHARSHRPTSAHAVLQSFWGEQYKKQRWPNQGKISPISEVNQETALRTGSVSQCQIMGCNNRVPRYY